MPLDLQVPDVDLTGFSGQARDQLKVAVLRYAGDLIQEANRVEAGRNSASGPPEVTQGMVNDANHLLRHGFRKVSSHWGYKLLRVLAAVLSLVAGILYEPAQLQSQTYMAVFVAVVAATILAVTISTLRD